MAGPRDFSSQQGRKIPGRAGSVAPLGLGVDGGTEPSAHALGYNLTALRAWGHGFGGREAAEVNRDRTRFFFLSFRYREGSHRHPLCPPRHELTRNPTGRSLPYALVSGSGSVSASESKTKRSIGIDPYPEADHLDVALLRWGSPGEGTPAYSMGGAPREGTRPTAWGRTA